MKNLTKPTTTLIAAIMIMSSASAGTITDMNTEQNIYSQLIGSCIGTRSDEQKQSRALLSAAAPNPPARPDPMANN